MPQLSFCTLFMAGFFAASLFALVNNALAIRVDAHAHRSPGMSTGKRFAVLSVTASVFNESKF